MHVNNTILIYLPELIHNLEIYCGKLFDSIQIISTNFANFFKNRSCEVTKYKPENKINF